MQDQNIIVPKRMLLSGKLPRPQISCQVGGSEGSSPMVKGRSTSDDCSQNPGLCLAIHVYRPALLSAPHGAFQSLGLKLLCNLAQEGVLTGLLRQVKSPLDGILAHLQTRDNRPCQHLASPHSGHPKDCQVKTLVAMFPSLFACSSPRPA